MPTLRQDQIEDLGVLLYQKRRHIHGGEPGTGKTPTICVLQKGIHQLHGFKSVWLMPMKLIEKNYDEAMLWGQWGPGEVAIVDGSPARCAAIIADPNVKVLLMGFTRFELVADLIPPEYKAIQIDEWHKGFGGHSSKRTQALYKWCNRAGKDLFFTPMTGTIYDGKPDTIYPAIQIIAPTYYGTLENFKLWHDILDPFTNRIVAHDNFPRLQQIYSQHAIRRLFRDIHGDQLVVPEIARVAMSKRQRTAYDTFRDQALLELERFFVDGTQPGVAFIRARQIMEHPNFFPNLIDDDNGPSVDITPGELPGKMELFEQDCRDMQSLGRPMLAYSALIPQQRQMVDIAARAGRRVGLINGSTSPAEVGRIDREFVAGKLDTIIGSDIVADCGYNWQDCGDQEVQDVFFVGLGYKDTTFSQAYKRAIRRNRKTPLRLKISSYIDSIDQHILRLTKRKSVDAARVEPGREPLPW
jgi:hypothetical protein